MILHCPMCCTHIPVPEPDPNGLPLFVAQDTGGSTECFDELVLLYKCPDTECGTTFYINKGASQ